MSLQMNYESRAQTEVGFQELSQTTLFGRAVGYVSDGCLNGYRWVLSKVEPEGDNDGTALSAKLNSMFPDGGSTRKTAARAQLDFQHAVEDAVTELNAANSN